MEDTKQEPVSSQPQVRIHPVLKHAIHDHVYLGFFLKGTTSMTTSGNKNVLNREIGVDGKRDWSFGLFDCFSACGLCM